MSADAIRHSEALARLGPETFRRYQSLLRERTGIFLSPNKAPLLMSRLAARLRELECPDLETYLDWVSRAQGVSGEFQMMVNRITTNKTDFFRERHHFDLLVQHLAQVRVGDRRAPRIWSAGCSSGEEPYSIAMALRAAKIRRAQILATDIDTEVLDRARRGVYAMERLGSLPEELWRPWCLRGTGAFAGQVQVAPRIRDMVDFQQLNLVEAGWPQRDTFDVVFCRNTLIYFDRPVQLEIVRRLLERVRPGGLLILGHSENMLASGLGLESAGITAFRRAQASAPDDATTVAPLPSRPIEHRIAMGGVYCSERPAVVRTLLGSCVAVCLFDPQARIGGMNHFLLPDGAKRGPSRALAYGVHAMEVLINEIMRRGGDRHRLKAKAFGAASVLEGVVSGTRVAERNAEFVETYLRQEKISLVAQKLGGTTPVDLRFETHTGRAFARTAGRARQRPTAADEAAYLRRISQDQATDDKSGVELFEVEHE